MGQLNLVVGQSNNDEWRINGGAMGDKGDRGEFNHGSVLRLLVSSLASLMYVCHSLAACLLLPFVAEGRSFPSQTPLTMALLAIR